MTPMLKIVIADDHPLYRDGVARSLSDDPGIELIGQARDAEQAAQMVADLCPDVVLLDLSMPKGGGIAGSHRIMAMDTPPRVAMLTASEEDDDVIQALKAGALGYILKGVGSRELVAVVKDIANGQSCVSPSLAAKILNAMRAGPVARVANPIDDLSRREKDILRLVAEGKSNKEVGRVLDLQEKTVKHYMAAILQKLQVRMTAILQKLQVRNRTEAAVLAQGHWRE